MATTTKTVKVEGMHGCYGRRSAFWVKPIGWMPVIPEEFRDEEYIMEENSGSVWGDEEEECGLAYFGVIEEGEILNVPLDDLNWVYCGASSLQRLDDPFVSVAEAKE